MAKSVPVKAGISERAHVKSLAEYERLYRRSIDDPEGFWAEEAQAITFFRQPERIQDTDFGRAEIGCVAVIRVSVAAASTGGRRRRRR